MPFKSEKQRKYLWKNHPKIAKDWTETYGSKPVGKRKRKERRNMAQNNEFIVIHKLQRAIKQRLAALSLNVTSGAVDNFDKYKYITGQIAALEGVFQEISNLLNNTKEQEHDGKVIRIDKDRNPKD